jgi:hypothetical protein
MRGAGPRTCPDGLPRLGGEFARSRLSSRTQPGLANHTPRAPRANQHRFSGPRLVATGTSASGTALGRGCSVEWTPAARARPSRPCGLLNDHNQEASEVHDDCSLGLPHLSLRRGSLDGTGYLESFDGCSRSVIALEWLLTLRGLAPASSPPDSGWTVEEYGRHPKQCEQSGLGVSAGAEPILAAASARGTASRQR